MCSEMCSLPPTHCLLGSSGPPGGRSQMSISVFPAVKYHPSVCFHGQLPTRELHQWPSRCERPALGALASGQHKQLNCALFPPLKSNHCFARWQFVMLRNVLASRPHWPERSRGRWRTQSRSRQSRCRTPSLRFLRAYRRDGYWGTTAWSPATPRLLHSWGNQTQCAFFIKSQHTWVRGDREEEELQPHLKRRVKACQKFWKLLWWFIAVSSLSSMFPNTWGGHQGQPGSQKQNHC